MPSIPHSPLAKAYFRFLQLAKAVEALLAAIGLAHLGSPATLHKRVTRLRQKEMLDAFSEAGDRRAKFLIPTSKALDYFDQLGRSMQQVQAATGA